MERKLSAILVADVAGYSRLMEVDEEGTLSRLNWVRSEIVDPAVARHRGRIFKTTGDGFLAEFLSAVDAVRCAAFVQAEVAGRSAGETEDRQILFRIGINVGDIVEQDGDIFGDGVNIAARLERIAEPGGICVSARVQEDVAGKIDLVFDDLGEQSLKNIARPVRAFRLQPELTVQAAGDTRFASAGKPSIAVLPFQNLSGQPDQEYFGDGIAEDIITALSKLRGFFVIARNSTFAYKGKTMDVRQIARELGVRYVLEGSVRIFDQQLRVTGQLVDATSGNHIWAERYDRPSSELFTVQDEITSSVVATIEPQLYAAEELRLKSKPPESLDAWGCVVRAMPHVWTWAIQDDDTGIDLLKRAIELDPAYARARSLLAVALATRVVLGNLDFERGISESLALAQRAIELDSDDPWSHCAAGYTYTLSRRLGPAVEELTEALQRNPNFAFARVILGVSYGYAGLAEEGLRQLEAANRLSPRDYSQAANLSIEGLCHFIAGRYSEAVTYERRAVQLRPHFGSAWRTLTAAAGMAGELDLAHSALAECKRLQPRLTIEWVEQYHPIVRSEDRARYVEGLRQAGL
ncbi:adenylate/guanylate cyclase domain-containing protein [Mesorhizobium marinum]|uniref:adenylate/guanylate cyclase domain-containing protein n=1 Tax=Mesorhizobium marinum TaxID=3228790 RepID=UPI003464FC95